MSRKRTHLKREEISIPSQYEFEIASYYDKIVMAFTVANSLRFLADMTDKEEPKKFFKELSVKTAEDLYSEIKRAHTKKAESAEKFIRAEMRKKQEEPIQSNRSAL